jgi:hypothetical protein
MNMENNMIGKNAWGLSIRPCDKGYEITATTGEIERINKTMDKAKIRNKAFPETHVFTDEMALRDFLNKRFPGNYYMKLSANQFFTVYPGAIETDEWGDYEIHDDVWGGTYAVRNELNTGKYGADYLIGLIRENADVRINKLYRVNYTPLPRQRRCPNCNSDAIEYIDCDLDPLYSSWQNCECEACKCNWTEHYEAVAPSKVTINNSEDVYKEAELFDE